MPIPRSIRRAASGPALDCDCINHRGFSGLVEEELVSRFGAEAQYSLIQDQESAWRKGLGRQDVLLRTGSRDHKSSQFETFAAMVHEFNPERVGAACRYLIESQGTGAESLRVGRDRPRG